MVVRAAVLENNRKPAWEASKPLKTGERRMKVA